MPKRAVLGRSRRELSLDVSVGLHILLVVEQSSSLESQLRGCAKTPILPVYSTVNYKNNWPAGPKRQVRTEE